MFPLRDVIQSRTTPWITYLLIASNILVFFYELSLDDAALIPFFFRHGLIPHAFSWMTVLTSMFIHQGWLHIISNMMSLWIFGDNVEDRFGHSRFLLFYVLAGTAGALAQTFISPNDVLPMVGASGAIAGVMGAYLVMFPSSRILVLAFLFFFIDVIELPAIFFLGFWFVMQLASGVGELAIGATGPVAVWAHAAGFLAGVVGVRIFRRPERQRVDWWTRLR